MNKLKDGDDTIIIYEDIGEYHKKLDSPILPGRDNSSEDSGAGFSGTRSFGESMKLLKYGDEAAFERIKKLKVGTDKFFKEPRNGSMKYRQDVVGFQPIVPNAIMGLPQSMVNGKRAVKQQKILNIALNMSFSGGTDKDHIELMGSLVLSALDSLENQGYRVNLYAGKIAMLYGSIQGHLVRLKRDSEPMNILKLGYYISNPSFLRRTCFRIDEVESELRDCTNNGYGSASGMDSQERFLKEQLDKNMMVIDDRLNIRTYDSDEETMEKLKTVIDID